METSQKLAAMQDLAALEEENVAETNAALKSRMRDHIDDIKKQLLLTDVDKEYYAALRKLIQQDGIPKRGAASDGVSARYYGCALSRTLTVHKGGCDEATAAPASACGCSEASGDCPLGWFCEEHVSATSVGKFMGGRLWAVLLCDKCFGHG